MSVAIIVEARMGSTRLPGKHMRPIRGRPMIARLLERLKLSRTADTICLATTAEVEDDLLEAWARELDVVCYRGAVDDVLGRVLGAARECKADVIAEITGDCPLVDPGIIDQTVRRHGSGDFDYVANVLDRLTYPTGFDVQVYRTDILAEVDGLCVDPAQRVDVTPYIYGHGDRYRLLNLDAPPALNRPEYRLCVDYPDDLSVVSEIFDTLYPTNPNFAALEIIGTLDDRPDLVRRNTHVPDPFACPDSHGAAVHEVMPLPSSCLEAAR